MPDTLDSGSLRARLGSHLLAVGKVEAATLERAEWLSGESGERLETVLTRLGSLTERDLAEALASLLDLPLATARDYPASPVFESLLSRKFLRESRLVPVADGLEGVVVGITVTNYGDSLLNSSCCDVG